MLTLLIIQYIYIHSEPGFVFNESTTRSRLFHDRQLKNSIKVGWGEASMIGAEDSANTRFVLLSESCIPLYNFSYIYAYLTASPRSFVDSFLDKKERQYNPNMAPYIPMSKWRKGSQDIDNVYYETEYRTEWCHNNSTLVPCFFVCKEILTRSCNAYSERRSNFSV